MSLLTKVLYGDPSQAVKPALSISRREFSSFEYRTQSRFRNHTVTQEVCNSNICSSFKRSEPIYVLLYRWPMLVFFPLFEPFLTKSMIYIKTWFYTNDQLSQITGIGDKFNSETIISLPVIGNVSIWVIFILFKWTHFLKVKMVWFTYLRNSLCWQAHICIVS